MKRINRRRYLKNQQAAYKAAERARAKGKHAWAAFDTTANKYFVMTRGAK